MVFLLIQICNSLRGLYLVNDLVTMAEGNLYSNSWKAVLILYCLKTCDIFFGNKCNYAYLRKKLSLDHYYKIVMRVEINRCDCLRNNDSLITTLQGRIAILVCYSTCMFFVFHSRESASFHANRHMQLHTSTCRCKWTNAGESR